MQRVPTQLTDTQTETEDQHDNRIGSTFNVYLGLAMPASNAAAASRTRPARDQRTQTAEQLRLAERLVQDSDRLARRLGELRVSRDDDDVDALIEESLHERIGQFASAQIEVDERG